MDEKLAQLKLKVLQKKIQVARSLVHQQASDATLLSHLSSHHPQQHAQPAQPTLQEILSTLSIQTLQLQQGMLQKMLPQEKPPARSVASQASSTDTMIPEPTPPQASVKSPPTPIIKPKPKPKVQIQTPQPIAKKSSLEILKKFRIAAWAVVFIESMKKLRRDALLKKDAPTIILNGQKGLILVLKRSPAFSKALESILSLSNENMDLMPKNTLLNRMFAGTNPKVLNAIESLIKTIENITVELLSSFSDRKVLDALAQVFSGVVPPNYFWWNEGAHLPTCI